MNVYLGFPDECISRFSLDERPTKSLVTSHFTSSEMFSA